jgi:hypothetical protein
MRQNPSLIDYTREADLQFTRSDPIATSRSAGKRLFLGRAGTTRVIVGRIYRLFRLSGRVGPGGRPLQEITE